MNPQFNELADALDSVFRGHLTAEEFRIQFPLRVTPELDPVLCNVEHFLSDADIRVRDVKYKEMQEGSMVRLIATLRLGDIATAGTVNFLSR